MPPRSVGLLALAACQSPSTTTPVTPPPVVTASATVAPPKPERSEGSSLDVVSQSADGAYWALRLRDNKTKYPAGPLLVLRTRDLKIVARIPVEGEPLGDSERGGGVKQRDPRFCSGDRVGLITKKGETYAAAIWDLATATPHPIALGDGAAVPIGWSETCEVIALGENAGRVSIRLVGEAAQQSFSASFPEGDFVDVVDVTADGVLLASRHSHRETEVLSTRLVAIDRKTSRPTTVATEVAGWIRRTSRSWVIFAKFGKAPLVFRFGTDGTMLGETPSAGDVATALDTKREVVAVFDGTETQWWSLSGITRVGSRKIQPLENIAYATLSFASDALVVVDSGSGDVVGVRRDGAPSYRHAFAISTCGGRDPCASGNMWEVMKSVASSSGRRVAIGTDKGTDPFVQELEKNAKRSFDTTVVDTATGALHVLPTRGYPTGFVASDEKLVIGEEVWSIDEGRRVGQLPR